VDIAADAASALRKYPLLAHHVFVVSAADAAGGSVDALAAAIAKTYVLLAEAKIYAPHLQRGGALVVVHPPFGSALTAITVLDKHGPVETGLEEKSEVGPTWDDAAPLSSALGLPVLSHNPTPFATFWNLPSITAGRASLSKALGLPELTHSPAPLSDAIGLATLSDNPAPLSKALGIPLLAQHR
jgi:hypothetical protein